jgi:hypothetical protein
MSEQPQLTSEVEDVDTLRDISLTEEQTTRLNTELQNAIDDGTEEVVVKCYISIAYLNLVDSGLVEKRTQLQNIISTNGWSLDGPDDDTNDGELPEGR